MTKQTLDVAGVIAAAEDPAAGAIASFVGTVRRSSSLRIPTERVVRALFYEAHPVLAEKRLREIAFHAGEQWSLVAVVIAHRFGRCELGEATVAIACGAPHRKEAFESCRWIIEELKTSVPIWKCEVYDDGATWVGMGS